MTLPDTVFFPQAMFPLHLFEQPDLRMLGHLLANDRMFAISSGSWAPEHPIGEAAAEAVATAGLIRACRKNPDGTADLVVQGLCRIRVKDLPGASRRPVDIEILPSVPGKNLATLLHLKGRLLGCIGVKRRLGVTIPREVMTFLKGIEEPDVLVDLAAFALCEDAKLKQRLLETVDTSRRLELYIESLRRDIAKIRLDKKLQGPLDSNDIWMN